MAALTVDGERYRVGTVLDFVPGSDRRRAGELWVLTAAGDDGPSFVAVGADGGEPPVDPPDVEGIRAARVDGDLDCYEVRPRYPAVGGVAFPGDVEDWEQSEAERRLARLADDRGVETDGGTHRSGGRGRTASERLPEDRLATAFDLAGYSGAFDRRPDRAVEGLVARLPVEFGIEDALFSRRWIRDRFGDALDAGEAATAVDRARAFAAETAGEVPRVAVPTGPGDGRPFASVPFLSPRVTGGIGGRPSAGSLSVSRACRQAWYSPEYRVSLVDADYRRGSVAIALSRVDEGASAGVD